LTVQGIKVLEHKFAAAAATINVINKTVAVRSDKARAEFTFQEERIKVVTEGYFFEFQLDEAFKAVIVPGGKGGPFTPQTGYERSRALVLKNNRTVAYAIPMHVHMKRLFPSGYVDGSVKDYARVEFELQLGAPVEAVQLLSQVSIAPVGNDLSKLKE